MGASSDRATAKGPTKANFNDDVPDKDLVGASAVLWLASLIRIAGGLIAHEAFGSELTAALLVVVFLPVILRDAIRRVIQHSRAGRRSRGHAGV